jgi:hypothetical protein
MRKFGEPKSSVWNDGLIWGGVCLAMALLVVWFVIEEVRDANSSAPTLSPTTLRELELDENQELLVDVEGFTIDCDNAVYHGEQLLAPGFAPDHPSMILVAFQRGSDCSESTTEQQGPFRAKAKAVSTATRLQLGIDTVGVSVAIVQPHHVRWWQLLVVAFFGSIGIFGVYSAFAERKRRLTQPGVTASVREATEPDDRRPSDPYRPGKSGRLITEPLVPAPAFLSGLRRGRTALIAIGAVVLVGALSWAGFGGTAIYEREKIWSTGVVAEDAVAQGSTRRSLLIIVSTELVVTFVDRAGKLHREDASAMSLIVGVDDSVAPVVRYDPDNPDEFAVSWIHEQLWGSLVLLIVGVGGLLALGTVMVVSGRRDRRPEQALAVFADTREALLDLIRSERQIVNGSETGATTHHFLVRDSERIRSHFVADNDPGPLFLDASRTVALALYHPREPEYLLVLSEDLRELDRPPFSSAQLRGRYEARASEADESAS